MTDDRDDKRKEPGFDASEDRSGGKSEDQRGDWRIDGAPRRSFRFNEDRFGAWSDASGDTPSADDGAENIAPEASQPQAEELDWRTAPAHQYRSSAPAEESETPEQLEHSGSDEHVQPEPDYRFEHGAQPEAFPEAEEPGMTEEPPAPEAVEPSDEAGAVFGSLEDDVVDEPMRDGVRLKRKRRSSGDPSAERERARRSAAEARAMAEGERVAFEAAQAERAARDAAERESFISENTLGSLLIGARATAGFTDLKAIERDLRIKARYLKAIEGLDIPELPKEAYLAGYVRSYAHYLRDYLPLTPEEAYQKFQAELEEKLSQLETDAAAAALEARESGRGRSRSASLELREPEPEEPFEDVAQAEASTGFDAEPQEERAAFDDIVREETLGRTSAPSEPPTDEFQAFPQDAAEDPKPTISDRMGRDEPQGDAAQPSAAATSKAEADHAPAAGKETKRRGRFESISEARSRILKSAGDAPSPVAAPAAPETPPKRVFADEAVDAPAPKRRFGEGVISQAREKARSGQPSANPTQRGDGAGKTVSREQMAERAAAIRAALKARKKLESGGAATGEPIRRAGYQAPQESILSRIAPAATALTGLAVLVGLSYGAWSLLDAAQRVSGDETAGGGLTVVERSDPLEAAIGVRRPSAEAYEAGGLLASEAGSAAAAAAAAEKPKAAEPAETAVAVAVDGPPVDDGFSADLERALAPGTGSTPEAVPTPLEPQASGAGAVFDAYARATGQAGTSPETVATAAPVEEASPPEQAASTAQVAPISDGSVPFFGLYAAKPVLATIRDASGATIFDAVLQPGQSVPLDMDAGPFSVRLGDASAAFMVLAGGAFGPIGAEGPLDSTLGLDEVYGLPEDPAMSLELATRAAAGGQ